MKIRDSLIYSLLLMSFFNSCKSDETAKQSVHDPSKPVVLKSFYPTEGGARDKILLDGENFGSDPSKIKVYFNNAQAAVVSSSGERIYAIVPRLPGEDPKISVVIGKDSVVYGDSFTYHIQAQVSTVTGTGDKTFLAGTLDQAKVYGKYLDMDAQGNLFMSWRDGGSFGIARINEKENIVTPLYMLVGTSGANPYSNGITVDRQTGIVTVSHESVAEVFFSFDPREAWTLRQRNAQFSAADYGKIVQADRFANFVTFCPYDGYLYTRFRDGHVAKIHPVTYAATIVHKGPYGSQYGQAINPAKPWELWMTLTTNADPVLYRQGLMMMDLRNPEAGFKRMNAPGGSAFRDGPLADAVFDNPRDIKFDKSGNMFIADYGNHCIRMLSADGVVSTVAGQPRKSGYKDGGPVESLFNQPWGVAVSEQGDIYIADWSNARIRKLVIE